MNSFFDENYQTPSWFKEKFSRRSLLKSAAGATAISALPKIVYSKSQQNQFEQDKQTATWQTLEAVLEHLLPSSDSGPGSKNINGLWYLHQIVSVQPVSIDEKQFILKGVGWLNGYSQKRFEKAFIDLSFSQKEQVITGISQSQAGENWLTTLLGYLFEALLAPPAYGGNPNGIGWHWLHHQAGFPLPKQGERYWEIPAYIKPIKASSKVNKA